MRVPARRLATCSTRPFGHLVCLRPRRKRPADAAGDQARIGQTACHSPLSLDDAMGMLPTHEVVDVSKVVIGARISREREMPATIRRLCIQPAVIDVNRREPVDLVIDSVVP